MVNDTASGRSPASQGRAAAADAVEPVCAVSSTAGIPNAGFTPGPWEVEGGTLVSLEVMADGKNGEGWTIAYPGEPVDYAGCPKEDLSKAINDEIEANARLIAAAPELYEALEACLAALDPAVVHQISGEARDFARAALAKARGDA